jgi:uncharacterized protein YcfJ
MKRLALIPLLATIAVAAHAQPYFDNARVSSVEPQYENVRAPRQECGAQWVSEPRGDRVGRSERDYGGAVLGGIVGALIGNQVGGGHGREAATAVGAVVGAFTGNHFGNRDRWQQPVPVSREVTACRDVEELQSRLVGYLVTYEYHGQQYTTPMQENPGRFVPVRVSVDVVGR